MLGTATTGAQKFTPQGKTSPVRTYTSIAAGNAVCCSKVFERELAEIDRA